MNYNITAPSLSAATLLLFSLPGASALAQLPDPGMKIDAANTALVITDPQNDFLSPKGVTWGVVGKNVTENRTVENLEVLFRSAKAAGQQIPMRTMVVRTRVQVL